MEIRWSDGFAVMMYCLESAVCREECSGYGNWMA